MNCELWIFAIAVFVSSSSILHQLLSGSISSSHLQTRSTVQVQPSTDPSFVFSLSSVCSLYLFSRFMSSWIFLTACIDEAWQSVVDIICRELSKKNSNFQGTPVEDIRFSIIVCPLLSEVRFEIQFRVSCIAGPNWLCTIAFNNVRSGIGICWALLTVSAISIAYKLSIADLVFIALTFQKK